MKIKRIISTILILSLSATLFTGCGKTTSKEQEVVKMEKEESNAISFDFVGGKDVMPICGYYGPYADAYSKDGATIPQFISDEYFKLIAEAGINVITYSPTDFNNAPDLIYKTLELGEKYNVGIFVTDSGIINKKGDECPTVEEAAERIANYSKYDSFCGMYLIDEPTGAPFRIGDGSRDISQFENLANLIGNELGIVHYSNLLGIYDYNLLEEYDEYVGIFCESLDPPALMWDMYPFVGDGKAGLDLYFWNMSTIRKHAEENKIPFWGFIQTGAQWNDAREYFDSVTPYWPNEAQFNWNVNTSLAYGVQGIQYFTLIQPSFFAWAKSTPFDSYRNGIIGALGNKTQWYNYVQNMSKHIGVIDEVLMNSVNKGVIVTGTQAKADTKKASYLLEGDSFQELQSVQGDTMIGCFNYNGKTALYVVNYSMEYAQHITLEFNTEHNINVTQGAETSYVKAESLTLDMAAGEGVLLVIE